MHGRLGSLLPPATLLRRDGGAAGLGRRCKKPLLVDRRAARAATATRLVCGEIGGVAQWEHGGLRVLGRSWIAAPYSGGYRDVLKTTFAKLSSTLLTLTQRNHTKHRATSEADIRLIYAGSATTSNEQKHRASDYESEGRRFESCRARHRNTPICSKTWHGVLTRRSDKSLPRRTHVQSPRTKQVVRLD